MAGASFDQPVVIGGGANGGLLMHDARMLNRHGLQAAAITDATGAAGANPTQAEYAALVAKFNALLTACRGVGLIASS